MLAVFGMFPLALCVFEAKQIQLFQYCQTTLDGVKLWAITAFQAKWKTLETTL
jgi:hypothetical protein